MKWVIITILILGVLFVLLGIRAEDTARSADEAVGSTIFYIGGIVAFIVAIIMAFNYFLFK